MHKRNLKLREKCFDNFMRLTDFVSDFVFPRYCIICGRVIPPGQKLCLCDGCSDVATQMRAVFDGKQINCTEIISALKYDGNTRDSMLKFKFKGIKHLGYTFGKLLADCVRDREFVNNDTIVTAVPIHDIRDREYNQAEVIARVVCDELSMTYTSDIFYKIMPIERLSGMEKHDKKFFINNAFLFNPSVNLTGKTVIVTDDVYTTGATLGVIANELKKRGAKRVYALTACYSKKQ